MLVGLAVGWFAACCGGYEDIFATYRHGDLSVHMRIVSLLLIATSILITLPLIDSRSPGGAPAAPGCSVARDPRPVTLTVPANGRTAFSIEDLVARSTGISGCDDLVSDGATISVEQVGQGSLSLPGAHPQQVAFIPRHGFSGMSGLWTLVVRDDAGKEIGVVRVTFEVRNSIPVAADDEIVVPYEVSRLDVDSPLGVLANDSDINGDQLVVYSQGVTWFPWGTVTIQQDGSYRIEVTDHALRGPALMRYLVWDQQGSPTSIDQGVLSIAFSDGVVAVD